MAGANTGYKQELYFSDEDKYGSAGAIDQSPGLVQSINPTETNNLIKVRTLGGSRDYANIVPGKFEVSGSFEYLLQGGAFLRQAIGEDTATTTTVDSGPKFHTGGTSDNGYLHVMGSALSPLADNFPSFTLEFTDEEDSGTLSTTANLKRLYTGARVNTLSISATIDEPVRVAVDWQAQGVTVSTAAASAVSAASIDPYVFYQGAVYATSGTIVSDTDLSNSVNVVAEVNSFDFSVNNNLEPVWYISGTTNIYQTKRGLKNLIVKGRDYEATLNLNFADKKQYQRFLGTTDATSPQTTLANYDIALDFVRTGTIGGVKASGDDYMRIVLKNCIFNDINIPGGPEDIVSETIGIDVESAKIFVVDTDASYK